MKESVVIHIGSKVGEIEGGICPFSSGTQYLDWKEANCYRCKKGATEAIERGGNGGENPLCEIETELSIGVIIGYVPTDIATRMGFFEHRGEYQWPCPEVEWTEEWKAEYLARKRRAVRGGRISAVCK